MKNTPGTENIYYVKNTKKEYYTIRKKINGKQITFGSADTLDEAIYIRDWCLNNNWCEKYPTMKGRLTFSEDFNILNRINVERNLKPKTTETYYQTVDHYTKLFNKSLTDLLELYAAEEETIVWKKRTLKLHLIQYRNHLYDEYMPNTAKIYFSRLLTLLRHLEIELGVLPKLNTKNNNELPPITYTDLLTKDELCDAYKIANPLMKAVILFQTSSGCARRETLNLTIPDFIEATKEYHNGGDINTICVELITRNDVVPTFKIKRQKTNKFYYTFCSPEAVTAICKYLLTSKRNFNKGHNQSRLFKINLDYLNDNFCDLNEKCGAGKVAGMNRIRSHMLRKFHASRLYNDGLSIDKIDALQGRAKDNTHSAYFKESPEKLKEVYIEHMDCLGIMGET